MSTLTKEQAAEEGLEIPTKAEDERLQALCLSWRSGMPPLTRDFEGIGKLNHAFYVDNGVHTAIFWRNENFQCKIYFIKRFP